MQLLYLCSSVCLCPSASDARGQMGRLLALDTAAAPTEWNSPKPKVCCTWLKVCRGCCLVLPMPVYFLAKGRTSESRLQAGFLLCKVQSAIDEVAGEWISYRNSSLPRVSGFPAISSHWAAVWVYCLSSKCLDKQIMDVCSTGRVFSLFLSKNVLKLEGL